MSNPSEATLPPLNTSTRLAYERTRLACERTMLAWVRTATALISFGFSIYAFFQFKLKDVGQVEPLVSPRDVGLFMIACGLVSLLAGTTQNLLSLRQIRVHWPEAPHSLATMLAGLMGLVGLTVLITTLMRG